MPSNEEREENLHKKCDETEGSVIDLEKKTNRTNPNHFFIICIFGLTLGILLEVIISKRDVFNTNNAKDQRKYWVYSAYNDVESKTGLLKHVHLVLDRVGYEKSTNKTDWNLLWSHDYPFRVLYPHLHRLKPHQKVNHFPGTGFITNKVDLAISNSKYIPKAFKLPLQEKEFLEYAKSNRQSLFLEKHNQHRGVVLKNVSDIDVTSGESFVQEYIQKPFLVDGYKFDIGVYVVITSVNPLRVYWYKGDVLFRYCPAKYYPFDPKDLDKYVVGDDYLPTWEVPFLAHPYTTLGMSMKDAFDLYVKAQGKDPAEMWSDVEDAIAEIFVMKERNIIDALKHYPSGDNFFELMRVDLVIDEDLTVHLLEANMSPNLSSAHFPPNQLLYEQVLYSLFSITGVATRLNTKTEDTREFNAAQNMISSHKNIAVWGEECNTFCRGRCEGFNDVCALCRPCLTTKLRSSLLRAHTEYLHRGDFRRLYPPKMNPGSKYKDVADKNVSTINKLQILWYQGKCNEDITWCS